VTRFARVAAAAAILCCALPDAASAQVAFVGTERAPRRVWVAAGWDPVWVTSLGYGQDVPRGLGRLPLAVDAALTLPVFVQPDLRAWKLSAGASVLFRAPYAGLALAASARATMALSHDPTGSKLGLGYELVAQPGYYGTRWTAALDAASRSVVAARLWHSEVVRDLFRERYEDPALDQARSGPVNGWVRLPANRVRLGAVVARRLGDRTAISILGAYEHTFQEQGIRANPSFGQLPFCILAGGDYRW
jgi:hypothetical protein